MNLVLLKTRHATVAVNPAEVSDVTPWLVDTGEAAVVRMRNRVEHVIHEPMATVLVKLKGDTQ